MTWTPVTQDDILTVQRVVLWIKTARAAGYGGPEWFPTPADVSKSALYERIRSGKLPLDYPPPRAFSCPWYAVVEDPGPHFVGNGRYAPFFTDAPFGSEMEFTRVRRGHSVMIFQSLWTVARKDGPLSFIVKAAHHDGVSPYEFLLWYDPTWTRPHGALDQEPGGWFLKNIALMEVPDGLVA